LEKLLQKNYFLHQSARDGYRSYLQAYASYSLKTIFNVNALDLAKVGKSFGFAVPPRINVSVGGGSGGAGRSGKKRTRDEEELNLEEIEVNEDDLDQDEENDVGIVEVDRKSQARRISKEKRVATLGKRMVDKEVYRKGMERKRQKIAGGQQWSR
jgi:ATP-dependent RNA helicase DDX18/HAS1